jgi:hypothetical protein
MSSFPPPPTNASNTGQVYLSGSSQHQPQQIEIITIQPTVRVMRLYKPCLHVLPTNIPLSDYGTSLSSSNKTCVTNDFSISPFILFPDSFGDIYTGEMFSAYIAVVNGIQDTPFNLVTLAIRLQTSNATYDLLDTRASPNVTSGQTKTLAPNEALDMVVQHTLSELGIHTLRVSVQYNHNKSSEPKTIRKFYRFSVLQPLQIVSHCTELHTHNNKIMVQTKVTNATKSPLYIEEVCLNIHYYYYYYYYCYY